MVEKSPFAGWWPDLQEPLRQMRAKVADWFAPRSDASAGESAYEINIELPGVKCEDVEISMDDNSLIVRGEKHSRREETGRNFFFSEREYGSFQRSFRLPPDSDASGIDASFEAGVLTIKIPRKQTGPTGRTTIKIRNLG